MMSEAEIRAMLEESIKQNNLLKDQFLARYTMDVELQISQLEGVIWTLQVILGIAENVFAVGR